MPGLEVKLLLVLFQVDYMLNFVLNLQLGQLVPMLLLVFLGEPLLQHGHLLLLTNVGHDLMHWVLGDID